MATDLDILKDTGTFLMGNGEVDAGIALEAAIMELKALRQQTASKKPVCPHCGETMTPTEYKGYYQDLTYWACSCESLPNATVRKGPYA